MAWLKGESDFVGHDSVHDEFYGTALVLLGYALETAARLLNIAPSKTVAQMPYQIGKPASYKYLRVWGSPAYVKRLVGDKLDSSSSLYKFIGYPKKLQDIIFMTPLSKRYLSRGMQCSWKEVFQRIPDAMNCSLRNQVRHLNRMQGHRLRLLFPLIMFQFSIGTDGEVTTFKTRLVAKGYTQQPGVNFEKTFLPVAMAKFIWIMLAIEAWYDCEIWQMDVKTAFHNGFVEEEIYMDQPEDHDIGEE
ncbi:UNVERIFIED_CONTAM: hypothetical protein Sradi_2506800 [Sesamum radiatum]|uniref:Reverse transcriptase Ty1/copia-type domain-containing protein n=1 Tax=Sesamum radiatum TaxID=300843 RepID=A0AAW2SJZ2_SESRA